MYIEGSSKNINDKARLVSPIYKNEANNTCLEFYYHMYGSGIGQLNVYLKRINDTWAFDQHTTIFTMGGNQGDKWWRGIVELGTINDQFQVKISNHPSKIIKRSNFRLYSKELGGSVTSAI